MYLYLYLSVSVNVNASVYVNDPTFTKVNRLFVLSFEKDDEDINDRFSLSEYFMPNVEIKDFNVLINDSKHYKLISIDLSKQIEKKNPDLKQQLTLLVNLKKMME